MEQTKTWEQSLSVDGSVAAILAVLAFIIPPPWPGWYVFLAFLIYVLGCNLVFSSMRDVPTGGRARFVYRRKMGGVKWCVWFRSGIGYEKILGYCAKPRCSGAMQALPEQNQTSKCLECANEGPPHDEYNKIKNAVKLIADGRWNSTKKIGFKPESSNERGGADRGLAIRRTVISILALLIPGGLWWTRLKAAGDSYPYIVPFIDQVSDGYQLDFTVYAGSISNSREIRPVFIGLSEVYDLEAYAALGDDNKGKRAWRAIRSINGFFGSGGYHWNTDRPDTPENDPFKIPKGKVVGRKYRATFPTDHGKFFEELTITRTGDRWLCSGGVWRDEADKSTPPIREISCTP